MTVSPFWIYLGLAGIVVTGLCIVFAVCLFVHAMREDHRAKAWRSEHEGAYMAGPWSKS